MPKVTFIDFKGKEHKVDAVVGKSLMLAAVDNLVPGIDADCGGECSCATCHVIVDESWFARTGPSSDNEKSMLDMNPDRKPTSRLSCQIRISDELEGLVVRLPEFQY